MNNIWSESAMPFILAALAGAGFAAVFYGAYRFWVVKGNKKQVEEKEAITFIICAFFIGIIACMFLVNQLVEDSKRVYRADQQFNCWHSLTADGKELTESQCDYFQDVLNGKYIDKKAVEDIEDSKRIDD